MIQSPSFPDTFASPSKEDRSHHIYEQYFTPEDRRLLAAIPENDLTNEINLLRALLAQTFALVPSGPNDKKPSLTLKFQYDLVTTFSRVTLILARLVALHVKLNNSGDAVAAEIWEAIMELNPYEEL